MENVNKKQRKSKGFTLVELLIVIIIIGILAGMMLLSTGSATDKAKATQIVSNMRNIKSAALMYYADEGKWPTAGTTALDSISKYLDSSPDKTVYSIVAGTGSGDLSVEANVTDTGVQSKLGTMGKDAGLYSDKGAKTVYTGGSPVYMPIRKTN